jgi:hypothetical protein
MLDFLYPFLFNLGLKETILSYCQYALKGIGA